MDNNQPYQSGKNADQLIRSGELTITEVTRRIGCERATLYNLMAGKNIKVQWLHLLAAVYQITFEELVIRHLLAKLPEHHADLVRFLLFGKRPHPNWKPNEWYVFEESNQVSY